MKYLFAILCCGIITPGIVFAQTAENDIEILQIEQEVYILERTGEVLVKIFGNIELDRYDVAKLEVMHTTPDGELTNHNVMINDEGYYEFYFIHDWNSIRGNYDIVLIKNGTPSTSISYELIQDPTYKTDQKVKEEYFMEVEEQMEEQKLILENIKDEDHLTIEADAVEGSTTIIITGHVTFTSAPVTIIVLAPNENMISVDQINPNSDGSFTTTIGVGGPMWKQDGVYTINAQQSSPKKSNAIVEVEIADGVVVPEFGAIASLVLVVAISSIIILSAKNKLRFQSV